MDYTEQARQFFAADIFATETTGIFIEEARDDYARCSLKIDERHLNAAGVVMGGAVFTLADFTFAVASNSGQARTVSMTSNINYLCPAHGPTLTAEANCVKSGKRTCTYIIDIFDADGTRCAFVTTLGHRI